MLNSLRHSLKQSVKHSLELYRWPIVTMLFLPAVLAELIFEATPARQFFTPGTLVLSTFLGYGLPVLVIRDFAARHKMGIGGIFVLGLAYGIYNEGFLAKTLIRVTGVPNPAFDHYSLIFGINTAWMVVICIYHAMCSVLFPILIVHACFPEDSEAPWLDKQVAETFTVIFAVAGCVNFLGKENGFGSPLDLVILLALIGGAVYAALKMKRVTWPVRPARMSLKPVLWGFSVLLTYMAVSAVADHKWPLVIYVAVLSAAVAGYIHVLKTRYADMASLKLFAAGVYLQSTLFGTFLCIAFHREAMAAIVTGIAATVTLAWWIRFILADRGGVRAVAQKQEQARKVREVFHDAELALRTGHEE